MTLPAKAAPIPGTGSSKLISPHLGIYRSPLGFEIAAGLSGWAHSEPPADNRFIATVYKAPEPEPQLLSRPGKANQNTMASKIQTQQIEAQTARASNSITDANDAKSDSAPTATLTVRVDQLPKPMRIDRYVQKWLKEYPRYGFDLLASKPFEQNKQKGFVVDLLNQDKGKQIRQVIFLKDRKAVILTCRDRIESFKNTINGCNEIIRTFKWTKQNDATSQQQASSI